MSDADHEFGPNTEMWRVALEEACTGKGLTTAHQPIVDTAAGIVVGYEVFVRFEGAVDAEPAAWFASAEVLGCSGELQAAALRASLRSRRDLPPGCFLCCKLSAAGLASTAVSGALGAAADLTGIVIELTAPAPLGYADDLAARIEEHRRRGAQLAIGSTDVTAHSLDHALRLRPDFLKLDLGLVDGVNHDPAKRAMIEMLGAFGNRLDALLIAEGVEGGRDLSTLIRLGVPLAQGYAIGPPTAGWRTTPTAIESQLRAVRALTSDDSVRGLLVSAPWIDADDEDAVTGRSEQFVVVVDRSGRPRRVLDGTGTDGLAGDDEPGRLWRVGPNTSIDDAAHRALARPRHERLAPLVCVDGTGRYLGIVPIDALLSHLAEHGQWRAGAPFPQPDVE